MRVCERCAGLGEDVVDEGDALRRGQEWTVLGVIVEVSHEGVEAGEGDAEVPGADDRRVRGYLLAEQIEIGSDDAIDVDAVPPREGNLGLPAWTITG